MSLTGHRAAVINYGVNGLDLSRWQFGITTVYHFLFLPITIGLGFLVTGFEHGALFLRLKTTGELRDRAARTALPVSAVAAVALIAAAAANWVRRAPEKVW